MTHIHPTYAEWPTSDDKIVDSRDIISRIDWLEEVAMIDDGRTDDEEAEYQSLLKLAKQGETLDDWEYGVTLIRDDHFTTYAQVLAEDMGLVDATALWPLYCIDWERAAKELQGDYTPLEWDGTTYWAR